MSFLAAGYGAFDEVFAWLCHSEGITVADAKSYIAHDAGVDLPGVDRIERDARFDDEMWVKAHRVIDGLKMRVRLGIEQEAITPLFVVRMWMSVPEAASTVLVGAKPVVVLGSLDAAVVTLRTAGTVYLLDSEHVFHHFVQGMGPVAGVAGDVAVLGVMASPHLMAVAKSIVASLSRAGATPGVGTVVGCATARPASQVAMRKACTHLLSRVRVRLPDTVRVEREIGRVAPGVLLEALADGPLLVDDHSINLRPMLPYEMHRHLYRATLATVIKDAHFWPDDKARERKAPLEAEEPAEDGAADGSVGEVVAPAGDTPAASAVKFKPTIWPEHVLYDLVVGWFTQHGGTFFRDEGGHPWIYYEKRLQRLDDKVWRGQLGTLTKLLLTKGEGRAITEWLEQFAMGSPVCSLRCWSWGRVVDGSPELRVLLGGERDDVISVVPGAVRRVANATSGVIHLPARKVAPIRWLRGVSPEQTSKLLWERYGRWLTLPPTLRALYVAWDVMLPGRQLTEFVPIVPIRWGVGPAGNGKSDGAKLSKVLWTGYDKLLTMQTQASLNAQADRVIAFWMDNFDGTQRAQWVKEWLLVVATGGTRTKMRRDSDDEILDQEIEAGVSLTSIELPDLHELVTRVLLMPHSVEHGEPPGTYSYGPVKDALLAGRHEILSGVLGLWAHQILPRLLAGRGQHYAAMVPHAAAIERQRVTLGTLGVIIEVMAEFEPRWGAAEAVMAELTAHLEDTAVSAMTGSEPIAAGLEGLRFALDKVRRVPGEQPKQIFEMGEAYMVEPLFAAADGTVVSLEDVMRGAAVRQRRAMGSSFPVVVGFAGTYEALHHAVTQAAREDGAVRWAAEVPTVGMLKGRWQHVRGWVKRGPVARPDKYAPRLYHWLREDLIRAPEGGNG